MKHRLLATLVACSCLVATPAAFAQGYSHGSDHHGGPPQSHGDSHGHDDHGHDSHRGPSGHDDRFDQRVNDRHGYQPQRWNRGDRLPDYYRGRQYVVNDWRQYRLAPPPRGQQWVSVGADFFLIAAATGLIAQAVLAH